jgi:hypothetical protein
MATIDGLPVLVKDLVYFVMPLKSCSAMPAPFLYEVFIHLVGNFSPYFGLIH